MKKSELKEIIKSAFLAETEGLEEAYDEVQEQEDIDVEDNENVDVEDTENVDVDVEKDVSVDDEETESDISIKTSVPGESEDVEAVQGLLTKAQQEAEKLGDEKLLAQIGNTITYFTRKHVVAVDEAVEEIAEEVTEEAVEEVINEEVSRFKKLAGLL